MLDTGQRGVLRSLVTLESGYSVRWRSRTRPGVALGGPKQRGLLAILVLEAGRVVPTDRLIDLLWGEEAPKSDRLLAERDSDACGALRHGRARDARAWLRAQRGPEQIDARRFERTLADVRRVARGRATAASERRTRAVARPRSRRVRLRRLRPGGDPRRLEEMRLVAARNGSKPTWSSADTPTSSSSRDSARPPAARDVSEAAHARAVSCGPAGGGPGGLQDARAFIDELGIEPGRSSSGSRRRSFRHEAGLVARRPCPAGRGGRDREGARRSNRSDDRSRRGPATSPPTWHLRSRCPTIDRSTRRVSQYVATMQGSGPLYDELHLRFEEAVEPSPAASILARLPAAPRAGAHQLIVTTNYDLALERAFEEVEELDIVLVATGPHRGGSGIARRTSPRGRSTYRTRTRPSSASTAGRSCSSSTAPSIRCRSASGKLRHCRGRHRLPRPFLS